MEWKDRRDAELDAKRKIEEAEREAQAHREQQEKMALEAAARKREQELVELDEAAGYKQITFDGFTLDKNFLRNQRVAIRGIYFPSVDRIFQDYFSGVRWTEYGLGSEGILLMTDNASRDAREIFLRCANSHIPTAEYCGIHIRGYVDVLTLRNRLGVEWQDLGIIVEAARP
jgi:hypothetical protein